MTARQPGEGRQGAKVSPETGTMWRRQRNQRLPSSISLQHRTPMGEISLGKARKNKSWKLDVLLSGEFYGSIDSWTEHLCLARNPDGSITLTSRSREILAEAGPYKEKDWLPAIIGRKDVYGYDGDYVVGGRFLPHDGDAEITVPPNQFHLAAEWLIRRKWDTQDDFGEAWAKIRAALYAPDFFSPAKPLPALGSTVPNDEIPGPGRSEPGDETSPSRSDGRKLREIVIRCAGPSKPWIISLEIVFTEWSETVYVRTGEAAPGSGVTLELPRTSARLSWREVLRFVQSHDFAVISTRDPQPIDIYGVEPWQRDVIAAGMMRLSRIVSFLARLPQNELRSLHERLGGFLSQDSVDLLRELATVTGRSLLARKSLTAIAQLVGSPDPLDVERLVQDCEAFLAERYAEKVLAEHGDAPVPPPELFLSLLSYHQPDARLRAKLFELWLRAEPKPKGGILWVGQMDDELPVLHWLLREQAAAVFQALAGTHDEELHEFVSWFLGKAYRYTEYFTGHYRYDSSIVYTFGRPRFAVWVRLAQEVQDAATSVGIGIPAEVRLPAMPALEEPSAHSR